MLKQNFVNELQAKIGSKNKKECAEFLDAFQNVVYEALSRGEEVKLTGFGTFKVRKIAAHEGVNPQSGEKIKIAETVTPAFKPGNAFKDAVKA
ncbi:MAG: HU family DNA-binding protein [Oscillospiraceae bacterium]|nr:HU family DNA-binding protein [Oscillospiraceae bacterium]